MNFSILFYTRTCIYIFFLMFKKNKNKTTYLIQIPFPSAIVAKQTNKQNK